MFAAISLACKYTPAISVTILGDLEGSWETNLFTKVDLKDC